MQRHRAGADPQDRSRCAAAAAWRGGVGSGRIPAARSAGHRVRQVFVLHRLRVGAPISSSIVGRAVDNALRHAGMAAPMRGANLLRHSLATELLDHGASLREIADLLGHSSLATTRIYASVDVAALREVALPWPQATS